jgi:hypothetical protein
LSEAFQLISTVSPGHIVLGATENDLICAQPVIHGVKQKTMVRTKSRSCLGKRRDLPRLELIMSGLIPSAH